MDRDDEREASQNVSQPHANSNTQNTSGGNSQEPIGNIGNPSIDVPSKCLRFIEQFRDGVLTKEEAIKFIELAMPRGNEHQSYHTFAMASYKNMLDNFETIRSRHEAAEPDFAGEAESNPDGAGEEETSNNEANGPASQSKRLTPGTKRKRTSCVSDEEEEDNSAGDQTKFIAAALPWAIKDSVSPPGLSANLRRTNAILDNISRDPKSAKRSLFNSPARPQFPESEWVNILAGHAVDMDHVFSNLFAVVHDDRRVERVGDLKITVGHSTPAKTVRTHGDWVIGWDRIVEATIYAFPHREHELRSYGRYISQLFAAVPLVSHSRVIQFDRACRVRVGQCQNRELSDTFSFTDLYLVWIQNAPSNPPSGSGRTATANSNKKRDACKRWNDNRCPNTSLNCTYNHFCLKCRSPAHKAPECLTTEKK
jgi:hypothetical protein